MLDVTKRGKRMKTTVGSIAVLLLAMASGAAAQTVTLMPNSVPRDGEPHRMTATLTGVTSGTYFATHGTGASSNWECQHFTFDGLDDFYTARDSRTMDQTSGYVWTFRVTAGSLANPGEGNDSCKIQVYQRVSTVQSTRSAQTVLYTTAGTPTLTITPDTLQPNVVTSVQFEVWHFPPSTRYTLGSPCSSGIYDSGEDGNLDTDSNGYGLFTKNVRSYFSTDEPGPWEDK